MDFTAREWRVIWGVLRDAGYEGLAERIERGASGMWQSRRWGERLRLELDGAEERMVREAAGRTAISAA